MYLSIKDVCDSISQFEKNKKQKKLSETIDSNKLRIGVEEIRAKCHGGDVSYYILYISATNKCHSNVPI